MDTPCYLCGMKTKKWMMLAAGVIMTTTPLFAQFNTVMPGRTTGVSESVSLKDDDMGTRQGKAFMEGCLSEEKSAPASSGEAGKEKFHNGIDLHARGDKVLAMMEGTVIKVGQDRASGKYVVLRHGEFTVSYCHLSRILVGKGAVVRPRDAVGITGNTGRSTGEHLHITCRRNGKSVNPAKIFNYIKTTREKCLAALAEMS